MFAIHSRNWTKRRATFVLFSSRRSLYATTATLFLAAFALVMQAGSQGANPRTKRNQAKHSDAEEGRKTFESVCATCHGLDGKGGERGPNVATRAEVQLLSDKETLRILRAGIPAAGMPAFGALGLPRIMAVMGYLRVLQGGGKTASVRGDPQSGKVLFFGKAGCAKCHMIDGAGGFLGADLSAYGSNVSIEDIRAAITDPNKDLEPMKRTVLVITRKGQQFTGIARNEDNFSLQLQSVDGAFHLFAKSDLEHFEYQPKSLMPADYGSVLSASELDDLVSFLVHTAQAAKQTQSSGRKVQREEEDD
jgi:putative heme-binding domain-containing protein